MAPFFANKGYQLNCEILTHIRDFGAWLRPLGIRAYNCWLTRGGVSSPHSFTFKLRMDLTNAEQQLLRAEGAITHMRETPVDVFCACWLQTAAIHFLYYYWPNYSRTHQNNMNI